MVLSFYAGNDWDWSAQHNWSAAGPKYADWGGWKFFEQDSDIALQDVNADCTDQDVPDGIFTRLMTYPDFRSLFRDRVYRHCFNGGMLTPARAAAHPTDSRPGTTAHQDTESHTRFAHAPVIAGRQLTACMAAAPLRCRVKP